MQYLIDAARSKKLDRIAIGYTVGAWAVIQAASIAVPTFFWPQWVLQAAITVALLGLPVVLIGGWTVGVRAESGGIWKPSRADFHLLAVLGLFLLIAGPLFAWAFWPRSAPPAAAQEAALVAPPNSLAVLPFVNLSGNKANDYFSDGITDELLSALSNKRELRVAARTSSFAFKGRNLDAGTIAHALHVRALLEGSVREAGNRVRITARLTNAADGYQLWSQSYDRDLTDILAVQTDISGAISEALVRTFLPGHREQQDRKSPTIDREAYRLYLQAKELSHRGNEDDLMKAADLLRTATARAPDFANGYATLANVLNTLVERYSKIALLPSAETAAQQALNIDAANPTAGRVLLRIRLDQWRWNDALGLFRKMESGNPNQSLVLNERSNVAYTFNYPQADVAAELKAVELDPLLPGLKYNLALWYWNEKRYDEAAAVIHQVRQLRQGKFQDTDMECLIEVGRGHLDDARRLRDSIRSYYAESPQNALSCPFSIAIAERNLKQARAMADAGAADADKNGGSFTMVADSYRTLGDLKRAMPWYERAYEARDTLIMFVPFEKYQSADLVRYPAWKALWARQPIREWDAARAEAGKILGVAK